MKQILFRTKIKDGKLSIYEKGKFDTAISVAPDGEYWGTLEKIYNKRSVPQNNSVFGIAYKILKNCLQESTGEIWTIDKVHEFCKDNDKNQNDLLPLDYLERIKKEWGANPKNQIANKETGETIILPFVVTTTKMQTIEMMEFYSNLQRFAAEWFGVEIPDPDPEWKTKKDEDENIQS